VFAALGGRLVHVSSPLPTRRSVYAGKLREFPSIALADEATFANRGQWAEFFRRRIGPAFDGRIIFEIGCFNAGFLSTIAAKFPNTAFVGLDWKCKAIYDGAKHVAERGQTNIVLLHGRGQEIAQIFGEREVDEVWLFHPDPCDRPQELKNRLIGEPFLSDAHSVLREAGSSLVIKTDHAGYYQSVLGVFGLPEPAAFELARQSKTAGRSTTAPGVRPRDLMRPEDVPAPSQLARRLFDVSVNSADYWGDPATQSKTAGRCFAGKITLFESRFVKKRLPIYYVEFRKRN